MKRLHGIILLLCLAAGFWLMRDFLTHPRSIWTGFASDRNGHYGYGLDMALALEKGDVIQFFAQLEKGKVWPPLHGLLVTVTQVISGNDWRLAVFPSLMGWMLMVWCVYYTAQKNSTSTGVPWAAGLIALIFAMMSPGGRLYATDIMLESLGAGLTMLALACYTRAAEERDSEDLWRMLAFVLTLMFFEKSNYWIIVVVSIAIAEAGALWAMVQAWVKGRDLRAIALSQWREPLNWLLLALGALWIWLFLRGPEAIVLFGKRVSLYPPDNLLTLTYAVLFGRLLLCMHRAKWKPLNVEEKMLWRWHVLPLAISFLLPRRLGVFIWYVGPADHDPGLVRRSIWDSLTFYWGAFVHDYNVSQALAILAVALALIALLQFRKLRAGARAVLICFLLSLTLCIMHPNQKPRFLHSWLPAVWTAAGMGAAVVLGRVRGPASRRAIVAGVAVAALAIAGGILTWDSIQKRDIPRFSLLDMSDRWLPDAAGPGKVVFVATQPAQPFIRWTYLNAFRSRDRYEWPAWQEELTDAGLRQAFGQWAGRTQADTVIYLDVQKGAPEFGDGGDNPTLRSDMSGLMDSQTKFKETKVLDFPLQHCTVTIWHTDAAK